MKRPTSIDDQLIAGGGRYERRKVVVDGVQVASYVRDRNQWSQNVNLEITQEGSAMGLVGGLFDEDVCRVIAIQLKALEDVATV